MTQHTLFDPLWIILPRPPMEPEDSCLANKGVMRPAPEGDHWQPSSTIQYRG